jgi:hypothetical protein
MKNKKALRLLRAAYRRGLSWVALTVVFNPLAIVDIDELADMELEENQLVYPDARIGAYVIFNVGGAV